MNRNQLKTYISIDNCYIKRRENEGRKRDFAHEKNIDLQREDGV